MRRSQILLLRIVVLGTVAFVVVPIVLSFGYGVDFVDSWAEGGRLYLGEGAARVEVPGWLFQYAKIHRATALLALLLAAVAGWTLRRAGDTTFERYVEGATGGCAISVLIWYFVALPPGTPLRFWGQCALAAAASMIGVAVVALRSRIMRSRAAAGRED